MVGQHLVVIFPAFLDVDNEDLLDPKGKLREQIPLHLACHLPLRPAAPDAREVPPVIRRLPNVLLLLAGGPRWTADGLLTIP